MLIPDLSRPVWHLEGDSCMEGGGAYSSSQCYMLAYPEWLTLGKHISQLEAINILIAVRHLGPPDPGGYHFLVRCDNIATVTSLTSGKSKDPWLAKCAREIWLFSATSNVRITIIHTPGAKMKVSDALSRACLGEKEARYALQLVAEYNLEVINVDITPAFFDENL